MVWERSKFTTAWMKCSRLGPVQDVDAKVSQCPCFMISGNSQGHTTKDMWNAGRKVGKEYKVHNQVNMLQLRRTRFTTRSTTSYSTFGTKFPRDASDGVYFSVPRSHVNDVCFSSLR